MKTRAVVIPVAALFLLPALSPGQTVTTPFSESEALQILKVLTVDIGPRPMGSPAERRAMEFALWKFREYGCDTAYIMEISSTDNVNTRTGIALGIKRGETDSTIVLGGHIDSAGPDIPGANDDGSGSAVVLEAARVIAGRHTHSSYVFCCFGGEEQGLVGSRFFASTFPEIDRVVLMLQVDMANGGGVLYLDPDTHGKSAPRWLVRAAVEEYALLGYTDLVYPTHFFSLNYAFSGAAGSDHEPFLDKGIPSIDFTSDVSDPIHTPLDNFQNFIPSGLKRSGDLVVRLAERFDKGVPAPAGTERYWLMLVGRTPVFIPFWGLRVFLCFALAVAVAAFLAVRRRREPPGSPGRIRWSGLKMAALSILIVAPAWLSSDLVSLVKGVRHPWIGSSGPYFLLAAGGGLIGLWMSVRLARSAFRLSLCPYVLYKRAVILLLVFLLLAGFMNIKLTVEFAAALFLLGLAVLVRQPLLKCALAALSPVWMIRVVFSEWSGLFFGMGTNEPAGSAWSWLGMNALFILALSFFFLPALFGAAAVLRDSPSAGRMVRRGASLASLLGLLALSAGLAIYLTFTPSYPAPWERIVEINQEYSLATRSKTVMITSGEYLTGLQIASSDTQFRVGTHTTRLSVDPGKDFDTTLLSVERHAETRPSGGRWTVYDLQVSLAAAERPYTVTITYRDGKSGLEHFSTSLRSRTFDAGLTRLVPEERIGWYSFPDSHLLVPVTFWVADSDSVTENIEVVFDKLAKPMECTRPHTSFLRRTIYRDRTVYRHDPRAELLAAPHPL
jgi:hypothetical protein